MSGRWSLYWDEGQSSCTVGPSQKHSQGKTWTAYQMCSSRHIKVTSRYEMTPLLTGCNYNVCQQGTGRDICTWGGHGETGGRRKLCNEETCDGYCLPNIIRIIQSRRIWWDGHVARIGITEMHTGFWWGISKESDHLEDPKTLDNIKIDPK